MDFEDQLATAMRASVETLTPPPVTDLVAGGVARGKRRRRQRLALTSMAAVVAVTLVGAGTVLVSRLGNDTSSTAVPASPTCSAKVLTGVLPTWARDGFSDPEPAVPHVLSTKGNMTAILFGATLHSPPSKDVNNKILWVTRPIQGGSGTLFIDAVRAGTTTHVRREVPGGPGPSTIDLPQPGCWHLKLHWGTQHDTIDLVYRRP
jgi:hypothetical protein